MTAFGRKNFYELLEVKPDATTDQIQRAYEHARRTFAEDSLAVYSLFTEEDRRLLLDRVEQAYRVLMNDSARRRYNQEISIPPEVQAPSGPAPVPQPAAAPPILPETISGPDLRKIREGLGITLEEISFRTRIHMAYLESIEGDVHQKLPPSVYLRSYLMHYAQMMGLDAAKVARGYLERVPGNPEEG